MDDRSVSVRGPGASYASMKYYRERTGRAHQRSMMRVAKYPAHRKHAAHSSIADAAVSHIPLTEYSIIAGGRLTDDPIAGVIPARISIADSVQDPEPRTARNSDSQYDPLDHSRFHQVVSIGTTNRSSQYGWRIETMGRTVRARDARLRWFGGVH